MRMTPVISPNIDSVGYEPSGQNLYVQMKDGFIHEYRHVPPSVYAALMTAEVPDVYLVQVVQGRYSHRRMMKLLPVVSSSIRDIGYDLDNETLFVRFNNGFTYEYGNVPPEVYATLMNADSIGAFFNRVVRGQYPYRRIWVERPRRLETIPAAAPMRPLPERLRRGDALRGRGR